MDINQTFRVYEMAEGLNSKRRRQTSEICRGQVGGKMSRFLRNPPALNPTLPPNDKFKNTLLDSGPVDFVPDGENRTKIGQAISDKRWRVCTHPRTCARRSSLTDDFFKTAERISTKFSM